MQSTDEGREHGSTPKARASSPGAPERSGGERSEPQRSEGAPGIARADTSLAAVPAPDPEVTEKAVRRQFSAKYKLRILREADACQDKPGEIGKLLRREGLYSSILSTWRRQREEGTLQGLAPKKRGRKGKKRDPMVRKVAQLEKENRGLTKKLEHAELLIEIQKKVSTLTTGRSGVLHLRHSCFMMKLVSKLNQPEVQLSHQLHVPSERRRRIARSAPRTRIRCRAFEI